MEIDSDRRTCKVCGEDKGIASFKKVMGGRYRSHTCQQCTYKARKLGEDDEAKARNRNWNKRWKQRRDPEAKRAAKKKDSIKRAQNEGRVYRSREDRKLDAAQRKVEEQAAREQQKAEAAARRLEERIERSKEKPWLAPGLSSAEQWRIRYNNDPEFHLSERLRLNTRKKSRCGQFGALLRSSLKKSNRSRKVEETLGYTIAELKAHLEAQFTEGMNWDVFATGKIHIDHRKPASLFDLNDEEQFRAAWSLDNLQPLWASDNIRKGAKWDGDASS